MTNYQINVQVGEATLKKIRGLVRVFDDEQLDSIDIFATRILNDYVEILNKSIKRQNDPKLTYKELNRKLMFSFESVMDNSEINSVIDEQEKIIIDGFHELQQFSNKLIGLSSTVIKINNQLTEVRRQLNYVKRLQTTR